MKKHIANVITCSRIIFSLPILLLPLSSVWFYVFYLFCGLTDMLDGAIARGTGSVSEFGAKLDTASDFVFLVVCSIKILPLMRIPVWLWAWILTLALVKLFDTALVFVRTKKLISVHSALNKATGAALFLLPLSLSLVEHIYSALAICALATVAVMQEVCFVAKGKEVL